MTLGLPRAPGRNHSFLPACFCWIRLQLPHFISNPWGKILTRKGMELGMQVSRSCYLSLVVTQLISG